MDSNLTLDWWSTLCAVGALNIVLWSLSALAWRRRRGVVDASVRDPRSLQLWLSAGYVFGCAYRSLLPVYDVQRLCLVDTWMSSVIIGRSVATIAELCFVAQWAAWLREAALVARNPGVLAASRVIVPMIMIAEICSWYSVVTTSNIGHVVEESLWGMAAALVVGCALALRTSVEARSRWLLDLVCVAGAAYVAYMALVDVPMYWARWVAQEAQNQPYLSLDQGLIDIASRRVVSARWQDWKTEVVWMTLYFSVGVWLSIGLAHARIRRAVGAP